MNSLKYKDVWESRAKSIKGPGLCGAPKGLISRSSQIESCVKFSNYHAHKTNIY